MSQFRFSLRILLGAFLGVALALGALAAANWLYASVVWTATVATLAFAVVASICDSGKSRAFWIGFAMLGWLHLVLVFGPWFCDHTSRLLLTSNVLERLAGWFGHKAITGPGTPNIWENLGLSADWERASWSRSTHPEMYYGDYVIVGQSLFSLAAGCCGGVLGYWFYARRTRAPENGSPRESDR